ncbi:thermonuclease family protein [Flavobacterium hauense]
MRRNKSQSKYTIGSLLLLLAFLFYMACNPDKKKDRQQPKENTVERQKDADTLNIFEGKVTGIKDGDTFEVLRDGEPERVRLVDIDSPESAQPFGKAAKKYASDLCFGKTVRVEPKKKRDQYGRILGTIYVDDTLNVNAEMIVAGYAWRYKYSKSKEYARYEEQARNSHSGLWAGENPVDPWQWRKENKR